MIRNLLSLFRKPVTPRDGEGRYVSAHHRAVIAKARQMYLDQGREIPEALL